MTQQAPDKINVFWFLPTHGDGRYLVPPRVDARSIYLICSRWRWQPTAGYYGVLIPTGKSCEDSWLVASALAPLTRVCAIWWRSGRACSRQPAARMAATLDRLSEGRLLINVVTGGDPVENKGDGIFLSHSERYQVTREFLDVYTACCAGKSGLSRRAYSRGRR